MSLNSYIRNCSLGPPDSLQSVKLERLKSTSSKQLSWPECVFSGFIANTSFIANTCLGHLVSLKVFLGILNCLLPECYWTSLYTCVLRSFPPRWMVVSFWNLLTLKGFSTFEEIVIQEGVHDVCLPSATLNIMYHLSHLLYCGHQTAHENLVFFPQIITSGHPKRLP